MNARIVFLLTLLALVQHIDGRHTIWAQLFDEPGKYNVKLSSNNGITLQITKQGTRVKKGLTQQKYDK